MDIKKVFIDVYTALEVIAVISSVTCTSKSNVDMFDRIGTGYNI